jgi:glycerol-1-phosphate dehydrogenase [NAD(P)+]
MATHSVLLPRKISTGPGAIKSVPDVCAELDIGKKPLIIVDSTTKDICGDDLLDWLHNSRMGIIEDSTFRDVEKMRYLAKGASCVISAGGGKVIDVGKLAAFQLDLPFVSVPTAPSNDGIASSIAAIRENGMHKSIETRMPIALVADTAIIAKAPPRLIAAGCGDIISNTVAVRDWRLGRATGEPYSEAAAGFSLLAAKILTDAAPEIARKSESGISDMVFALITTGASMALFGSSRPASGSEHMFSHALDKLGSKGVHGEQCGIGSIIMAYWQEKNSKDSAIRCSNTWARIRDTLKQVGAPTTFKEAGINPNMALQALVDARGIRDRYTILTEHPLDLKTAERICQATGVA